MNQKSNIVKSETLPIKLFYNPKMVTEKELIRAIEHLYGVSGWVKESV
jgi:hypothetical protein